MRRFLLRLSVEIVAPLDNAWLVAFYAVGLALLGKLILAACVLQIAAASRSATGVDLWTALRNDGIAARYLRRMRVNLALVAVLLGIWAGGVS